MTPLQDSTASPGRASIEYVLSISMLGMRLVYMAVLTAFPLYLAAHGVRAELVGVIVGMYGYAAVPTDLLSGVLTDRFGPKRMAGGGIAAMAAATLLLASAGHALFFSVARLLQGMAMGFFLPSVTSLVMRLVRAKRRGAALGLNQFFYHCGTLIGPIAIGFGSEWFGMQMSLFAAAGLAALVLVYTAKALPTLSAPSEHPAVWDALRETLALIGRRNLQPTLILVLADVCIYYMWIVYLPLFLVKERGFSLPAATALISLEGLSYAAVQLFWGRVLDRWGYWAPAAVSLVGNGLLVTLVPLTGGGWAVIAALFVLVGIFDGGLYPAGVLIAASRVTGAEYGRAMGVTVAAADLGQMVGPFLGAAAYAMGGGFRAVFTPAVLVAILGLGAAWFSEAVTARNSAPGKRSGR